MIDPDDNRISYLKANRSPQNGDIIIADRYWVEHKTRGLLFWRSGKSQYPQCNPTQRIAITIRDKLYPWAKVRFYKTVAVPNDWLRRFYDPIGE